MGKGLHMLSWDEFNATGIRGINKSGPSNLFFLHIILNCCFIQLFAPAGNSVRLPGAGLLGNSRLCHSPPDSRKEFHTFFTRHPSAAFVFWHEYVCV
jgi:hypothetical protein